MCAIICVQSYVCNCMCNHMCVIICVQSYVCSLCVRYVWCHRKDLARSVHDLAKQMYANTKYSPVAWKLLTDWVHRSGKKAKIRDQMLTRFTRDDTDFHEVVARCHWRLANAPNTPWGRGATQPKVFSAILPHEKVCLIFFLNFFFCNTYMSSMSVILFTVQPCWRLVCSFIYYTNTIICHTSGLVFRVCRSGISWICAKYGDGKFSSGRLASTQETPSPVLAFPGLLQTGGGASRGIRRRVKRVD